MARKRQSALLTVARDFQQGRIACSEVVTYISHLPANKLSVRLKKIDTKGLGQTWIIVYEKFQLARKAMSNAGIVFSTLLSCGCLGKSLNPIY